MCSQPLSGQNQNIDDLSYFVKQAKMGKMDLSQIKNSDLIDLQRLLTPKMNQYIPHVPTSKQSAFLLLNCKEAFYGGAAGGGKALSLDTPILTSVGWKTIGTLTLQDNILSVDGTWTEIEYITDVQKEHDCYEIIFNNSECIVADAEHLWQITEFKSRKYWKDTVVNTTQLRVGDKLPNTKAFECTPIDLGIDPYVFGFWLGDGNSHTGSVTIGNEDIEEMSLYLPPLNSYESMNLQYTVQDLTTQLNGLNVLRPKQLNRVNCPETKHIPQKFFLSSYEQRLELLCGLMDSDGHCQARGRCEISLKEKRLFTDVCTLLSTLGIVYSVNVTKNAYRATFSTTLEIFKLTRKKINLPHKVLQNKITITSIKYVGKRDVKCIRIKHPSHIFLCGKHLVPTHNSDALLMGGLQYVDVKGYAGIIFRKSYADLTKPGALIDRAKEWLFNFPESCKWNEKDKKFEFFQKYGSHKETISTLQFGYLENVNDKYNYQGGEYQYIGFDELTHIDYSSYKYMFSRLRRLKGTQIPLRVRGASNPPDDDSGIWVKTRFIDEGPSHGRIFIPAGMDDNPYLDSDEYSESLQELDPVQRARLRDGNWEIVRKGNMFKRDWFQPVEQLPPYRRKVRWWDMAATDIEKAKKKNKSGEPDYTVGLLLSEWQGIFYIEDIIRVRKSTAETEALQKSTAQSDGYTCMIREEQEPGSSGISVIDNKARTLLLGYDYKGINSTGNKTTRASAASSAAERGQIKYLRGCRNIEAFFNEAESFPGGLHDDMVDGLSGGFTALSGVNPSGAPLTVEKPAAEPSTWASEFDLGAGYFSTDFRYLT